MKQCGTCQESKPFSEFGKNAAKKDGYQASCRVCRKSHNKKYYSNTPERNTQRTAWLDSRRDLLRRYIWDYLATHPCVDCGECDRIVLEFDHLRDKMHNIGDMLHRAKSLEDVKLEIAKCEVRCANCHRKMTAKRGNHWRYASVAQW